MCMGVDLVGEWAAPRESAQALNEAGGPSRCEGRESFSCIGVGEVREELGLLERGLFDSVRAGHWLTQLLGAGHGVGCAGGEALGHRRAPSSNA